MRTSTAVVILGGGVAALWAIASSKEPTTQAEAQPAIDASIKKALDGIAAQQKAGKSTP
jgi:NADH dehydrogenase FAD-containing subunit